MTTRNFIRATLVFGGWGLSCLNNAIHPVKKDAREGLDTYKGKGAEAPFATQGFDPTKHCYRALSF